VSGMNKKMRMNKTIIAKIWFSFFLFGYGLNTPNIIGFAAVIWGVVVLIGCYNNVSYVSKLYNHIKEGKHE